MSHRAGLLALMLAAAFARPARAQATAMEPVADPYELVASHATSADRWHAVGDSLRARGRHREAIAAYERALQLGLRAPHRAALEVARSYAALGNERQAVRWVERALELGLSDRAALASPDFDDVRGSERFRGAVAAIGARGRRPVAE